MANTTSQSDDTSVFPDSPSTAEHENTASIAESEASFASDSPIESSNDDKLRRAEFAQQLAKTIAIRTDPSCLTIGLYGAWGSGKTSMLNMIKEELQIHTGKKSDIDTVIEKINADNPVRGILKSYKKKGYASDISVMDFNPWFFRSEEALLQNFLAELSKTIQGQFVGKIKETIGRFLEEYSDAIALVATPVLPPPFNQFLGITAKEAGKKLSSTSIRELKEKIEEKLLESKKKTVVFIDDIDRLDKEEIHALFKIIKLNADFPYVTYVLAFDHDIVSSSLQERYCDSQRSSGEAFLEKIIQVPLHMPKPDKFNLNGIVRGKVKKIPEEVHILLSDDQKSRFNRCFTTGILPKITTLRLSNLYCNALLFSLSVLEGEVCPVDLMLIEGIRLFYPKLYDDIRNNFYDHLIPHQSHYLFLNEEERKKGIKEFFENNLSKDALNEASQIKETLLLELFPSIGLFLQDPTWHKEKKICSEQYFSKYFMYAVPLNDISDKEIESFLALFGTDEETKATQQLQTMFKKSSAALVLRKCVSKLDTLTQKQATSFLDFFLCNMPLMIKNLGSQTQQTFFYYLSNILTILFKNVDEKNRGKFFLTFVRDIEPISFVVSFFWKNTWILKDEKKKDLNPCYKNALSLLANRIKDIDEKTPLYTQHEINAIGGYSILREELGYEKLSEYLISRFDTFPEHVDLFLESLGAWENNTRTSIYPKENISFEPVAYSYLEGFINLQYIAKNLTDRFGEKLTNDYEATDKEEAFPLAIAREFMNRYN